MSRTVGTSSRGIETGSKPPPGGNQGSRTEKVNTSTIASKKNGTDESNMNGGTRTWRIRGARGHAIKAPRMDPSTKEMRVETVNNPSVQGTALWIFSATGCGKSTSETPRSRLKMLRQ